MGIVYNTLRIPESRDKGSATIVMISPDIIGTSPELYTHIHLEGGANRREVDSREARPYINSYKQQLRTFTSDAPQYSPFPRIPREL